MPEPTLEWLRQDIETPDPTLNKNRLFPDDEVIVSKTASRRHGKIDPYLGKIAKIDFVAGTPVRYYVQNQMEELFGSPLRPDAQLGADLALAARDELTLVKRGIFADYVRGHGRFESWFDELSFLARMGVAKQESLFYDNDSIWTRLDALFEAIRMDRLHGFDREFIAYEIHMPVQAQYVRTDALVELERIRPKKGFLHPKNSDRKRLYETYGLVAALEDPAL